MESGGSNESLPAGLTDRPIRPGGASPSQVALRVFFYGHIAGSVVKW
jgi:hypothetical protein